MAEMDAFERRVAVTLVGYADEAAPTLDAATVARRAALAHPRRAAASLLPWRLVAIPRVAWVLLLAGLLAALIGGTLLVGAQVQRRLPAVVPPVGQVYECPPGSNPDEPGPVDQARPAEEWSAAAFDRRAGRLVVVTNAGNGVETWTFDACTNTWALMHPDREPPSFEWGQFVYDVDSEVTIWVSIDRITPVSVWAYDLQTDTWTEQGAAPTINLVFLAYDPVTGLVVAADYSDLGLMWTYEVETDTWAPIDQANAGPSEGAVIAYDTSVDRLVAYGDGPGGSPPYETWLFDIRSGTWSRSAAERPAVAGWLTPPGLLYDEAAERTLVFGRVPYTAYDATADRWEILAEEEFTPYVYDAVNQRLVGWGTGGNDLPEGAVVALDLATREWTVLLEPSGRSPSTPAPRPAPTSARTATPSEGPEETDSASPVATASPTSSP